METYRNKIAYAQANNPYQHEGQREKALQAAKTSNVQARQWQPGDDWSGLAVEPMAGDYIISDKSGQLHISRADFFEMLYEKAPKD